jgi:hypothetical protein
MRALHDTCRLTAATNSQWVFQTSVDVTLLLYVPTRKATPTEVDARVVNRPICREAWPKIHDITGCKSRHEDLTS